MTQPPGEYRRRVIAELRVRCLHLRLKEAMTGLPEVAEQEFLANPPACWCDRTGEVLGPDGRAATPAACAAPGRACYDPPPPRP